MLQVTHTNDCFVSRADESLAVTPVEAKRKDYQSVIIEIAGFHVQYNPLTKALRPTGL